MATETATRVSTDGLGLLSPASSPHAARTAVYDRVVEASFERGGGGPAAAVVEHATPSSSTELSEPELSVREKCGIANGEESMQSRLRWSSSFSASRKCASDSFSYSSSKISSLISIQLKTLPS